ncbi:MAG: signal peptidase II [Candidatus Eisenbacteria bacterium]
MKRFLISAAALLVLDQITKWLVYHGLAVGEPTALIDGFVRLKHVRNAGSAFGLIEGSRLLFILLSLISIAAILVLTLSKRFVFRGSWIGFGVVLGGAMGNLIDRFWLHQVIDFIDIGVGSVRWPTFNVADIGVTLGVIYLAFRFAWPCERHAEEGGGAGGPEDVRVEEPQ